MGKPSSSRTSMKSNNSDISKKKDKKCKNNTIHKTLSRVLYQQRSLKKVVHHLCEGASKDGNSNQSDCNLQKNVSAFHSDEKTCRDRVEGETGVEERSESQNTIVCLDDTKVKESLSKKRKACEINNGNRKIPRTNDSSCIVINDDDAEENAPTDVNTPKKNNATLFSSTPISKTETRSPISNFFDLSNESKNNNANSPKSIQEEATDLTREINRDSYLTIDLTTETVVNANCPDTVIDLESTTEDRDNDCTVVSVSQTGLSMSGDSDVTVLNKSKWKQRKEKRMQRFANGIANLNASEKGRLLELITEKILGGTVAATTSRSILRHRQTTDRGCETAEDTFIKEVILGQKPSRNSIGSNIYNPQKEIKTKSGLRMIVIDGSNVAMGFTKGREFSVKALRVCIEYFVRRGHIVKAFVPHFRNKFGKSTEPRLLDSLERGGLVVYTPSREIQGRMISSYDDRYIVQCAAEFDGVIVSRDYYRDLMVENPRWRSVIENRLLPFTWVNDMIMFPRDPFGRNGPTLEQLLRHGGSK